MTSTLSTSLSGPLPVAGAALPAYPVSVAHPSGVRLVVGVAVEAGVPTRSDGSRGITKERVLATSGGRKVRRVAAGPILAAVIEREPSRDQPDEQGVGHTMRPVVAAQALHAEDAVPIDSGRRPVPTAFGLVDLRPEPVNVVLGHVDDVFLAHGFHNSGGHHG